MIFSVTSVTQCVVVNCDRYEWKRDMNAVDFSSTDDTGTLTIHTDQPTATSYEGVYQCFVHNGVGKAMSDTTRVVKSVQAQFPERSEGEYQRVRATIGKPLTLDCNPNQPSIPSPNFTHFSWKDKSGQKVWPITKRSRIDDEGTPMYAFCVRHYCAALFIPMQYSAVLPQYFFLL